MGDVGVRITLVKQRDSNSTGTPSQILKSTLKESGRFCYHLFSAEQRKPQDHLELATLCFVDSCFRNVLYHSLSIQIAPYPTIPIEQTLHLAGCRLRHLDIIQVVLKSPSSIWDLATVSHQNGFTNGIAIGPSTFDLL